MLHLQAQDTRGSIPIKVAIGDSITELYRNSYALLIGNSEYDGIYWKRLPGVKKDIDTVSKILQRKHGFQVRIAENLNKDQVYNTINTFVKEYGKVPENRLLVYYAGHGHTIENPFDTGNTGYIVPIGAPGGDSSDFETNAIEMDQIDIISKRIASKHVLFIFDACFAGTIFESNFRNGFIPKIINQKVKSPVRQFITSGKAGEKVPDSSIFRRQFVKALTTNEADGGNKDGYLSGTELGEFLQNTVTNDRHSTTTPQYGKSRIRQFRDGDFVFILPEPYGPKSTKNNSVQNTEEIIEGRKAQYKIIAEILNIYFTRVDNVHKAYSNIGLFALEDQAFFDEILVVVKEYNEIFELISLNNKGYQLEFEEYWGKASGEDLQKIFQAILNKIHKKHIFENINGFMVRINGFRTEANRKRWSKKKAEIKKKELAADLNKTVDSLKRAINEVDQDKEKFLTKLYSKIN